MNRFFKLAKEVAANSTHPVNQIGCVLVYKNRVISIGFNSHKTDPNCPKYYKPGSGKVYQTCHAEYKAIKNFDANWIRSKHKKLVLRGAAAYVYRSTAKGALASAKCCVSCLSLLRQFGVSRIFFTSEGKFEEEIVSR